MFNEMKNLPDAQKKLLRRTITMTSMMFLGLAVLLWGFREKAMELTGFDESSIDIVASVLCIMVVVDLVFVKILLGEDKAK